MKRILSTVAVLVATLICATVIVPLAACVNSGNRTLKIANMANYGLSNVAVEIYKSNNRLYSGTTDDEGKINLDLDSGEYNVKLANLPKGYTKSELTLKVDSSPEITLNVPSFVIEEEMPSGNKYSLGNIIHNFTLRTTFNYNTNANTVEQKTDVKLYDVLKEKKVVLLNFWYTTCSFCLKEFPAMQKAYEEYSDKVSILAIDDPGNRDNDAAVATFVSSNKYTFDMGMDTANLTSAMFNFSGWPETYIVDRYGIIVRQIDPIVDDREDPEMWKDIFEYYSSDNYIPDNINFDKNEDEDSNFVPDIPDAFGVTMSNPLEIDQRINKTGKSIQFSADNSPAAWPWQLADDGQSIFATSKGHRKTSSIIYARLDLDEDKVLTFEYKHAGVNATDLFSVLVDAREGLGRTTMATYDASDWKKGYAYIPLEAGSYEIAFVYIKNSNQTQASNVEDTAYIKNLRLEDLSVLDNEEINMHYFAARGRNYETGGFDFYADVYKDENGYYRVKDEAYNGVDPYLYISLSTTAPYFTEAGNTLYNTYISKNNCIFNNRDYYPIFSAYVSYSSNSSHDKYVPVRDDLKQALTALYNSENSPTDSHYSTNGWLEFCSFFKHYGKGESLGNTVEGLAYFSAYDAIETTGVPNDGKLNQVEFEKMYVPRGKIFKFIPETSGAYKIQGINKVGTEAWLYDRSLETNPTATKPLNTSGYDDFPRDVEGQITSETIQNFCMYEYLEAGKTYYIQVAFRVVEDLGTLKFRIDRIGDEFEYLTTATSGFYTQINNKLVLKIYVDPKYNKTDDVFYDATTGSKIYCDFISPSRMFTYAIDDLLDENNSKVPKGAFNVPSSVSVTVDGVTYYGRDFTDDMKKYLEESKKNEGDLYGMLEVNFELQIILRLVYQKQVNTDDNNEWLKACWYKVHVGPNK